MADIVKLGDLSQKIESLSDEASEWRSELLCCLEAANHKPTFALALCRSVGERLAKSMVRGIGLAASGTFDACLRQLEQPDVTSRGLVPAEVLTLLHKTRTFGNKAIHADSTLEITDEHVVSVVGDVLMVVDWYLGKFEGGPKLDAVYRLVVPASFPGSSPDVKTEPRRGAFLESGAGKLVLGAIATSVAAVLAGVTLAIGRLPALGQMSFMQQSAVAAGFLGLPAIVINRIQVRRLEEVGREKQQQALDELSRRLLGRVDNPQLLTPQAARGLAHGVERAHGSPLISDRLIIEAIRRAALALEDLCSGSDLTRRLTNLNTLLLGIDAQQKPLLSIANTDRLIAYVRSQSFLMGTLFVGTVVLALVAAGVLPAEGVMSYFVGNTLGITAFVLLLFQAVLLVSTSRSIRFWSHAGSASARPVRLSLALDFLLLASMTRSRASEMFWDNLWGPLWENNMLFLSAISPRARRTFFALHEFRHGVARLQWRRLLAVQEELDDLPGHEMNQQVPLRDEFTALCRELFVITGDKVFREIEQRGQIHASDMENATTQVL